MIIAIVALMGMVVVSLVRGIIAFLQTTKVDLESNSDKVTELQLKQNRLMASRVKFQALAIVAVAVLLLISNR
ncbi:HIG1 domain-containing protein [Croceibacterium xixiisoli]|nr:HIG1 domain-containing protein [Croceibacterium xixiisoli]